MQIIRFIWKLVAFLALSFVLAYTLVFINMKFGLGPEKDITLSMEKKGVDFVLVVYTVTLGFIGIFSMYNSLEIYKKKEQFDKELTQLFKDHDNAVKEVYEKIKYKINKNHERNVKDLKKKYEKIMYDIDGGQDALRQSIDIQKNEIHYMGVDAARYYYYFIIINSINNKMITKDELISSLMWFAQRKNINDLEVLERFRAEAVAMQNDVLEWCEKAISEIRQANAGI